VTEVNVRWPALIASLSLAVALPGCEAEESRDVPPGGKGERAAADAQSVRPPAQAGGFYPASPAELRAQVESHLHSAKEVDLPGELIGLVVPHAGYVFSGPVAGWGYRQLEGKQFDTVVLLGPSHHVPLSKHAVSPEDAYKTPLGNVPLDKAVRRTLLAACDVLVESSAAHEREHSLEVQLPFLQCVLKDFKIVPIALGQPTKESCRKLARALAALLPQRKVLIIASTDLSHYPSYEDAQKADKAMLTAVEKLDPDAILAADKEWMGRDLPNLKCTMCGLWPAVTLAMVAEELGSCSAKVLKYANSGDVPAGSRSEVVGYGAVAVCRKGNAPTTPVATQPAADYRYTLDEAEQKYLLALARQSLEACVNGKKLAPPKPADPKLTRDSGAFVTLKKHGALRGCIGYIEAVKPLYEAIAEMAESAALRDPRFNAVKPTELGEIDLEISVLSPLRPLKSIDEIVVGKHGLVLTSGLRRGVLLPQVPTEQGWNRDQFLEGLCRKTGVPDRAWEKGAKLEVFTAQVFGERE
jgi:AmmeMemoRadiSam system protein B/AmmeMemoRadiSam system protein A